jgi:kumamolisin
VPLDREVYRVGLPAALVAPIVRGQMSQNDWVHLAGSERVPLPGARRIGAVDPQEQITVTVLVRRAGGRSAPEPPAESSSPGDGAEARRARRRALAAAHGASQADVDAVTEFATAHGLSVLAAEPARRTVRLSGTAEAMGAAFGVELVRHEVGEGDEAVSYRQREGSLRVPAELAGIIEAVLGLDDRPQARFGARRGPDPDVAAMADPAAPAASGSFWTTQVARLYGFPGASGGAGEAIAIIELGGGYAQSDLTAYFGRLGITPPTVVTVGVDSATNSPGQQADVEVVLDIEVAGAVAPKADLIVYFAPNTDAGFLDAITTAVHDQQHAPSAISISWGGPESAWTDQAMRAMDAAFADAAAVGVSVLCAAGDRGAGDGGGDQHAHADFPASSPHVVACGGTALHAVGGKITSEVVWNDRNGGATGGGISDTFGVPSWQPTGTVPASVNPGHRRGRGVPDVAGNADPRTGYLIVVNGGTQVVGGTSAVAPLYAGLVALLNAELGAPVGELSPKLYALHGTSAAAPFRDIISGDNSVPRTQNNPAVTGYRAGQGWDACTGLGSINGTALLAALRPAGTTPSR